MHGDHRVWILPIGPSKALNNTDHDLAEFAERIARLEEELAETRRVNAAWRALRVRSELVLHRISRRLEDVLQGGSRDGAATASGVLGTGGRRN